MASKPSTEMNREEFDVAYPPGSEMRREEEVRNPRPEEEGQSAADVDAGELEEFRAWKASQQVSADQWKAGGDA